MVILEKARSFFNKQAWSQAFKLFESVDRESPLDPPDLESMSVAAYLLGNDRVCEESLSRAHNGFLKNDDTPRAIRCAFWLALTLIGRGEVSRGGGWIARAQRLLKDVSHECVELAYLKIPAALKLMSEGHFGESYNYFMKAEQIANRYSDIDIVTLAHLGQGQNLVFEGDIDKGLSLLDEAMITVESGETSPLVAGIVYCAVIDVCHKIFDLQRAREWTDALSRWCESQPDMVPYRGQCFIRRAEIMHFQGEWQEAIEEVDHACEWLSQKRAEPSAGEAFYRQGEMFRMTGAFDQAEMAYKKANKWGRKPQPGLAILRLQQGEVATAKTSIIRELKETKNELEQTRILPAYIEIMIASGEISMARKGLNQLKEIETNKIPSSYLRAIVNQLEGHISLLEDNLEKAREALVHALLLWNELHAPYEAAKTRLICAMLYFRKGDNDMALMELESARSTFQDLGAKPDLEKARQIVHLHDVEEESVLSPRENEVLQLICQGETNKSIASSLFISERTVERHVSNIFNKLGVSSRSAATSYAFKHGLI